MKDMNVLEFAESELGITLYPLQQTLLKIIFGIPLDYRPQTIDVWDDLHETKLYTLSEPSYLSMCFNELKCNYGDWRSLPPNGFNEAHLIQGRRSGKTTLLTIAATHRLYQTLSLGDPHRFFNLVPNHPIDFTLIGIDIDLCSRWLYSTADFVQRAPIFAPYLSLPNKMSNGLGFFTDSDRKRDNPYASLHVGAYPATANVLRGPASIGLFFDEFSHFKNADDVYNSSVPSTMSFQNEGGLYSLILSASSPWYTNGKAFRLHSDALTTSLCKDVFTHNETTATLYPHADAKTLRRQKAMNTKFFEAEFCGKFLVPGERDKVSLVTLKEYLKEYR